jgi:site-specific DNA-methyltransferase (adenine-specific)
VILDEEAGALLDEQTGVLKSGPSYVRSASVHSENVEFNPKNAGTQQVGFGDSGGASRFFYCAKVSKSERGEGNNHPTLKPIALMRYLARLVTPPGATVLDPFMGSGSTGLACQAEGFDFIGIEREAAYMEIARRRLGMRLEDDPMFG